MDEGDGKIWDFGEFDESICSDEAIEFAVVFGSQVSGTSRSDSDVDLAVKFSDSLTPSERFRKRCFLSGSLQQDDAPFVDVSDIERLPIDVAVDAVAGELLCGNKQSYLEYKSTIESRFETEREALRRHERSVIERIAEDGLHG